MLKNLSVFLVLLLATPAYSEDAQARLISVSGIGEVAMPPDMATVTIGASFEAGTAAEALARTSDAVTKALSVLEAAGIEPRDIQTSGLNVSPRWMRQENDPGQPPRIAGYIASNDLMVRVRDLDALGPVLDAAVDEGANALGGISFGLQDPLSAEDEARRRAVSDAQRKAALYAEAAGVGLGPLISLSDAGGGGPQPTMLMREAAMADAVPVAAGELTVSARVSMVFAIAD